MIIVFDLDGTLCNIDHRLHLIQNGQKKWPDFYKACSNDKPVKEMVDLFKSFPSWVRLEIWSGRSDIAIEETKAWLRKFVVMPDKLRLREDGDHRDDVDVKEKWLLESEVRPDIVFEDRQRVVDMWRRHGVMCCQVAPGNF